VATNYRPISLTSQLCKVFETIVVVVVVVVVVRIRLLIFLETNVLLETPSIGLEKVVHV